MKGKKPAAPPAPPTTPKKKASASAKKKTSTRKERPVPRTLAGMGREMPRPAAPPPIDPRLEDTIVIDTLPHSSRPVRVPSSDSIDAVTMELPAVVEVKDEPAVKEEPAPFSRRAAIIAESKKYLEDEDADDIEDVETTIAFPRKDPSIAAPPPAVVAQIRELEAQLDRLIDEASRRDVSALAPESEEDLEHADTDADGSGKKSFEDDLEITRDALPESLRAVVEQREQRSTPNVPAAPPSEATVFDTARELLSSDFYLRKWGRMAMRGRSEEVDDFGFDPIYEQKFRTVLEFLYSKYFRVETSGIERVPSHGRCLLVANHSGTVPLDGVMLKTAVKLEHPGRGRDVRWLTEDFIYHMPYLGSIMNRLGAVRACQENAERLLGKEQLVAVFPEGVKGIGKLFSERYRLQRFGRGGFIKLCLRTQTPIVPVAVVGAEETNPLLFRFEYLSKAMGVPYVPVTPTFPLLGPLGLLPAPTKWTIEFGEPLDFSGHGADAADDELLVGRLAERVRATIQSMLDRKVGARKSVFFG
jgi:1-acyl-sn-glycerol-3-phosphate acyltransferase